MLETEEYFQFASDPLQYDAGKVDFSREGDKWHFTRRMIFEAVEPFIGIVVGKDVLDVGCGTGWLCDELAERGARTTGIDSSSTHIAAARKLYRRPHLKFEQQALADYESRTEFDLITATMVFEHFADLRGTFEKLRSLLKSAGRLAVVTGDIDRYTMQRFGYTVDVQRNIEKPGEVAVRTDYGERAGVLYDIFRHEELFEADAALAGLKMKSRMPYAVREWVLRDQPRYHLFKGMPIFQAFEFVRE